MADTVNQQTASTASSDQQSLTTPQIEKSQATQQLTVQPQRQKKTWYAWTGFSGKTAWDWLQFLSAIAIPIVVLAATLVFTNQQDQANKAQHDSDQKIAQSQQEEDTLKTYLDDMTTLLLNDKLGSQAAADKNASTEAAVIARAKTLTVLHRLTDPQRKATVVQFLYEAHLIGYCDCNPFTSSESITIYPIIHLSGADLSGAKVTLNQLNKAVSLQGATTSDGSIHP